MKITANNPLLQNIPVGNFVKYLRRYAWEPAKPYKKGIQVFQGPLDNNGEPLEIVLPDDERSPDKEMYTASALNLLSVLNNQTPEDIAQQIQRYDYDVLRIRNLYNGIHETIDLPIAAMQVFSIKQLLAYAACGEGEPLPYFRSVSKRASRIVKEFQFAHTFPGSFGFAIESPVGDQQELPLLSNREAIQIYTIPPIERRVMERLVRGLLSLQQALLRHEPSFIARAYSAGLNANMCRAMLQMSDRHKISMEYKISWSPKIPPSNDITNIDTIILDGEAYSYLSEALTELKAIPPEKTTIMGNITGLISRDDPMGSDDTPRLVMIRGINRKDGNPISVGVILSIEDYKLAIDAHMNWKMIEISGELTRVGNSWQLCFYYDFIVSSLNRPVIMPLIEKPT